MSLWTPEQQSAIDEALNQRRADTALSGGGMTEAQKSPATTSTSDTLPTTTPTPTTPTSTTPTGGNAPVAQTAPTSSTVGAGGGSTSGYMPSQNLPGYNYTKPTWLDNMSTQDQMNYYKGDPNQAQLEINRAKQVYSDAIAKGDTAAAQRASSYADQIRQATGIANNDPFYGSVDGDLQSQGQANLSVNGQNPSSVNVYNGTSYDDAAHLAQTLGLSYSRDQNGNPIIGGKTIDSSYIDKNGNVQVPTRLVGNLLGMKVDWDPNKSAVTITGGDKINQLPSQPTAQQPIVPGTSDYMNSVVTSMPQQPQITPYQAPDFSSYYSNLLPYQQFNQDSTGYYNSAHNQIDPLYQGQYNQLMNKQTSDMKNMDESMNRRGIYTSGIAEAAANDLRAKTSDSIANLFSKQMSDIEKTAHQLYNDAYTQYKNGNDFALKNNTSIMNQVLTQQKQSFTQWLGSQKLDQQSYQYAVNAWDKMAGLIQHDVEFNQTMDWNKYKFENLSADQSSNLQMQGQKMEQDWAKATLPYNSMTQYQQGQLNLGQQSTDIKQQTLNASNYFKQLGINIDQSKLEELIRHNQAGEQSQADSNKMKLYDMMGFGPNGTPTMKRDQLDQTIAHDNQTVQIAKDNATTTANKSIVDGIGKQLSAINSQIAAMYNQGNTIDQNALKALSDKRDDYLKQLSQYTNQGIFNSSGGGFIGPPDPANFTPVSP